MVVEEYPDFFKWLSPDLSLGSWGAMIDFLTIAFVLAVIGAFWGYLVCAMRHGPQEGAYVLAKMIISGVPDILKTWPPRTIAIARLAIQESIRRRVLLSTFVIFALTLLISGWYLDTKSDHPDRVYLGFVMWGTQLLTLLLVFLLSAFSLPAEIQSRTIYTIWTKPVRASEIVLGRIIGFGAIGTVLLVVFGVICYAFVVRGLSHTHTINTADFVLEEPDEDGSAASRNLIGLTTVNGRHQHKVTVRPDGTAETDYVMGHTHNVAPMFDMAGKWRFELETDEGDEETVDVEFTGTRRSPRAATDDDKQLALNRIQISQIDFRCQWPSDLLDTQSNGQVEATISVAGDGESLELNGSIVNGSGETLYTLHAEQTERTGDGDLVSYEIGDQQGMMLARVPKYGRLGFLDRRGLRKSKGVNVGNEWTYRSYIEGGRQSLATAIWTFEGIREGVFPNDDLPLEMTLSVFRTYKGQVDKPIHGHLVIRHPTKRIESVEFGFDALEFQTLHMVIPRKFRAVDEKGEFFDADLYEDLVDEQDGNKIQIRVKCDEAAQYFGMAQADLYMRAKNSSFALNFAKAYISIWLQMLIVTSLGVMFSTFLSTAVTLLATIAFTSLGFVVEFVRGLATGDVHGGGPLESLIRIITQKNVMMEFEQSFGTQLVGAVDHVLLFFMDRATYLVPRYENFNTSNYLAYGFNIQGDLLAMHFMITMGFIIGLTVVSYFFLKAREIAA